jgi:CheY-like chemotaxis protein
MVAGTPKEEKTILVVDDEPGMRALFSFMLGAKGYQVDTAASGKEAIAHVETQPCDLIFIDIRMPAMDGVQVLKKVKAQQPDVSVIMMTGYAVEKLLDDALAAGAVGYLRKPFTLDELLASIRDALGEESDQ